MNIDDIRQCAHYFTNNYLETFYIVVTYNGNGFILIGEKENFPHLMGISNRRYKANGYGNPRKLYKDIISGGHINSSIIPNSISSTSKMFRKVVNFQNSTDVLLRNKCPVIIKYDHDKNLNLNLNNVDILLSDLYKGYMLGWVFNNKISVNSDIKISKYCISTWVDESDGSPNRKEKYTPNQDIELLKYVLVFDKNSELQKKKEYKYSKQQKIAVLDCCYRNGCNLLLDDSNAKNYRSIAKDNNIICSINHEA